MFKKIMIIMITPMILIIAFLLYHYNVIPHKQYESEAFNIDVYHSEIDKDKDGIDDQSDILANVRSYIETSPKYQSKYYAGGYPDDGYGVCTDVVAFGLKGAGYDLMELVNEDILKYPQRYNIDVVDKNIDFRRVKNLNIYFKNNHISLTNDISKIKEWQGGDIVVFRNHIAIISDKRNHKGIPFIIHHFSVRQIRYEEDLLEQYRNGIVGHYRIS